MTFYWYGGSGNWSDYTNHWSLNSGNSPASPAPNEPTATDDVVFDANSSAGNYTVTFDANQQRCQNFTCSAPASGNLTFNPATSSWEFWIYGDITLYSGLATGVAHYRLKKPSGTCLITSNGCAFQGGLYFDIPGTTYKLADNFTHSTIGNRGLQMLAGGKFDANGKTYTVSPSFGSSHTGWYIASGENFTGSNAFYNLIFQQNNSGYGSFIFTPDIEVKNSLTINGYSSANRAFLITATTGTKANIICNGTLSVSNADFMDINASGTASWDLSSITGGSGDCGGNSGITFTPAQTNYWYTATTGSKNWYDSNWYLGSGGTGGAGRMPLPQDDARFDANSIGASSTTIVANVARLGKNIDFTGVTNSPTLNQTVGTSIFGSLILSSGMTRTGNFYINYFGRGNYVINTAGISLYNCSIGADVTSSYTFMSDVTTTGSNNFTHIIGTLKTNGYAFSTYNFNSSNSNVRTIDFSNSTITLNGPSPVTFATSTNLTLISTNSNITVTMTGTADTTFNGGAKTFNNLTISGSGTGLLNLGGGNTFNVLKIDSSASAKSVIFTAGSTTTVNYLDAWGNATYGISLNSSTTGTFNLVKANGGVVNCDYLTIAHCVATPASTWYAGTHSTNNQGVATAGSGWTFTFAPGRYWVGGSGNWDASDTTHWATSSGGTGGASVPGTTDDVFFDRNSNATSYTVTATTSSRNCRNLIYSNPATGTLGLTGGGSYGQNIYGWMYVGPSVDWGSSNAGTVIFKATSGTNGILTNGTVCKGQFTFDGVGGTWILCDDFNITRPSSSLAFTRTNGTFNANGKTIVWTAGGTAPSVGFTGFTGTNSLYNLTLSGSSAQMVMQTVDLTITGTLKTVGTAGTRILVRSGTRGVQGIITSAINNFAYTDFEDIIGAGAGSWDVSNITGGGGDCGGNTGITFASPRNLYFYTNTSGTKLFSVVSNWYNGSGGTGGNATYYPLAQDTAIFDANSVVASTTVNMDLSSTGSINMLNVANSPNFVVTQSGAGIYGSFYAPVTSAMNTTTFTLRGRGNHILASNGQTFQCTLVIDAITGTYSLLGDITIHYSTDRALSIYSGTFNTNDYNITADNFTSSTSNTRTLNLGNSVITLTGTSGNVFSVITSTGLTLNAGTSTIRLTSASGTPALQFAGANLTFYNLEINTTPGTTVTLNGTNPVKFNRITFAPGQTVLWTAACNFSVKEFVARGTNALPISFNSTTTGTYTLTSRGGFVQADYLTIAHCVATPAYTWYAGKNSVNNQGVATAGSGWIFTDAPNAPNFSTNF